jgi:toxin ParE1/3/4
MSRIIVSDLARSDLDQIWVYIAEDNLTAADDLVERVLDVYHILAENPRMGRVRRDLHPDLRSFPVGKYVVFYRRIENGIEIVRVLSGHRDIPALF